MISFSQLKEKIDPADVDDAASEKDIENAGRILSCNLENLFP